MHLISILKNIKQNLP